MTADYIEFDIEPTADVAYDAKETLDSVISVSREFLPVAIKHGMELWWDGSTPTKRLDQRDDISQFVRYVNTRIEGKLAEVAFGKFLHLYYGIKSQVDWRIYGDYEETDDSDLQHLIGDDGEKYPPAVGIEIKKTKPWNQWLAIRERIYQKLDQDDPIVLVKHDLVDDLDVSEWEDTDDWLTVDQDTIFRERLLDYAEDNFPLRAEFVGSVFPDEFTDWFKQGDQLYDPDSGRTLGDPLRCDNWGIHVSDLYDTPERWDRVVSSIVGDSPISWSPLAGSK